MGDHQRLLSSYLQKAMSRHFSPPSSNGIPARSMLVSLVSLLALVYVMIYVTRVAAVSSFPVVATLSDA